MANEQIANLSLNPSSISDFTGVNVSEGMARNLVNNAMRQFGSMTKAAFAANTGTITSASTLTLASISTGDYILLTPSGGSTSITSFGTATEGLSKQMRALGTLVLRHDTAKLNLPSGADLSISTGDEIYARAQGGTVWNVTHEPYSGVANAFVNATSVTASDTTSLVVISNGTPQKVDAGAVARLAATEIGYRAVTTAITISAADKNYVLDFTSASLSCHFLASTSLSAAFNVTIMNSAATGDIFLNSPSSLDGLTTRSMRPGDRANIINTGSTYKTLRGVYSYTSPDTSYSVAQTVNLAHGLGIAPKYEDVAVSLVSTGTNLNYSIGDVVDMSNFRAETGGGGQAFGILADATNVTFIAGTVGFGLINKTTRVTGTITPADWRIRISAAIKYG